MPQKYCRKFEPPEQGARTLQTTDGRATAYSERSLKTERFQKATKSERQRKLKLYSFELGYVGYALTSDYTCYRIVFRLVNLNFSDFFVANCTSSTRRHNYKLFKPRSPCCSINLGTFFLYCSSYINVWNARTQLTELTSHHSVLLNEQLNRLILTLFYIVL